MSLASIEVECNRRIVGEVEVSWRVRLMLRSYNHIADIPPEGLNNGTFLCVACIRIVMLLGEGWMLPSTRTKSVEGEVRDRSSSRGVVMSREERGRRTLSLALSRHRVGPKILTDLDSDGIGWIYAAHDPKGAVEAVLWLCDVVCTVM
jgi:hypothetical protein